VVAAPSAAEWGVRRLIGVSVLLAGSSWHSLRLSVAGANLDGGRLAFVEWLFLVLLYDMGCWASGGDRRAGVLGEITPFCCRPSVRCLRTDPGRCDAAGD
jgi:hypothetical protein